MEFVTTGMETVTTWFGAILSFITAQPLLTGLFVAGTIVPAGMKIFKRFKHS